METAGTRTETALRRRRADVDRRRRGGCEQRTSHRPDTERRRLTQTLARVDVAHDRHLDRVHPRTK
ncbi:hypothetical protein B1H29_09335 [Streptomyces pactum]|uniref:Uncharacterized protein n=1 Tax=Streptomyces pactum TaxID=68249 RepID=A0A1S6J5Q1_9ACTN|nr:hypothetical protein B1H29_09335 [Streptomyces pactum]